MNFVTICLPFYRNRGMLQEQCRRFRELHADLKAQLALIVVDDGSRYPQENEKAAPRDCHAIGEEIGFPFALFEIEENRRWNQDAARNIAVHHAPGGMDAWLLLTDMDHIPHRDTLNCLIFGKYDPKLVYKFSRETLWPDGRIEPYKPHPNSWFMTRRSYEKVEGYDEALTGYYGTDADFRNRIQEMIGEPIQLKETLIRVPRDTIPDASTTSYERKTKHDKGLGDMIRARNTVPGWHPKRLTFRYREVARFS